MKTSLKQSQDYHASCLDRGPSVHPLHHLAAHHLEIAFYREPTGGTEVAHHLTSFQTLLSLSLAAQTLVVTPRDLPRSP